MAVRLRLLMRAETLADPEAVWTHEGNWMRGPLPNDQAAGPADAM